MENTMIGKYCIEDIDGKNCHLLHSEKKTYICSENGEKITFKALCKYSEKTDTFVGETAEGGQILIDSEGICSHTSSMGETVSVFDEIGAESDDKLHSRPVKLSGKKDGPWTYCTYTDGKIELEYPDYCTAKDGLNTKLGARMGDNGYYCLESYPPEGNPYFQLRYYDNKELEIIPVGNLNFSKIQCVGDYIMGVDTYNRYRVFTPKYNIKYVVVFDNPPIYSKNLLYWAGLFANSWVIYSYSGGRMKQYKKKYFPNETVEFNEDLEVFVFCINSDIVDILDMTYDAISIAKSGFYWKKTQTDGDIICAIDYTGDTFKLSVEEYVRKHREFTESVIKATDKKVYYSQKNLIEYRNEVIREEGFNAAMEFAKEVCFSDWKIWYFRTEGFRWFEKLKVIKLKIPEAKIENTSLVLVEAYDSLYVCNRLKEKVGEHIYYLSILFELKHFPNTIFKDVASGTKMNIQELFAISRKEKTVTPNFLK